MPITRQAQFDAVADIASGAWTTVTTLTPSRPVTVTGFNADVEGILELIYRLRLQVGGTTQTQEAIASGNNSWIPISVDADSGVAVTVDIRHSDVNPQDFSATISYEM